MVLRIFLVVLELVRLGPAVLIFLSKEFLEVLNCVGPQVVVDGGGD